MFSTVQIQNDLIRVLLIEDDINIQTMLKTLLRTKIVEIHPRIEGLKTIVSTFDPHVILLDFMLEDGNAIEALTSIQPFIKKSIPIVFTAYQIPSSLQTQLYFLGVMNILMKPSSISTIESIIENYYEVSLKYRN